MLIETCYVGLFVICCCLFEPLFLMFCVVIFRMCLVDCVCVYNSVVWFLEFFVDVIFVC